jgi:hypothetical protein
MKRILGSKPFILIVGVISILALVYLAASLSGLEFKPGTPFAYVRETNSTAPGSIPSLNPFAYVIAFIAIGLVVMFFLLPPDQRKKFLWALARLAFLGIVLFLIISRISLGNAVEKPNEPVGNPATTPVSEPTVTLEPAVTPSVFVAPPVSSWLTTLLALGFLLVAAGAWVWWVWRKRKNAAPLDELAGIAQETLDDLDAGKDWGDTVLNCYYRMMRTVETWRHIHRRAGMTPAEFAGFLASAGLPREAVFGLTEIFERVRYGGKKSTSKDVGQATDCLTAILDYCREA